MSQNEQEDVLAIDLNSPKTNKVIAYPNIKSTFSLFFILLLYMLVAGIIGGIILVIFYSPRVHSPILKSLLNLVVYVTSLLIAIRYALRKGKKQQGYSSKIDFNKIQGWLVPLIIIGTLAIIIPLEQSSVWISMPKSVQKFFEEAFKKDVFSITILVIAAPILEEILCRGIILKGLLKNYSPYKAILISAIFFGAMHMNPWQAIPAFLNGLFLGWVYYRTQSVIPGMIMHATINTTATLFLFLPGHHQGFQSLLGTPVYLIAFLLSVLVFTATCIIIHKKVSIIPDRLI
jgi:membrane protease YdiL (CAAX protease family)